MKTELRDECAGKWANVLQSIGIDERVFNGQHQPCIYCGGKDRARFDRRKEFYICNACGPFQPIEMAMQHLGMSFKDTAEYIRPTARTAKMNNITPIDTKAKADRLKNIHGGLQHLHSTNAAGLYLIKRGLSEPPKNIFFHPGIPYYDNGDKLGVFPAMVSRFQTAEGLTASYHITYLNDDGTKAYVPITKKFMSGVHELAGGAIRLAEAGDILGISEGIETGMALMAGEGIPVWAAGSAILMEKISVPETVKRVVIAADNDKSFTGQAAAYALAKRLRAGGLDVCVINLMDDDNTVKALRDKGLDMDYLDHSLLDIDRVISAIETGFGPLAGIETQLMGRMQ